MVNAPLGLQTATWVNRGGNTYRFREARTKPRHVVTPQVDTPGHSVPSQAAGRQMYAPDSVEALNRMLYRRISTDRFGNRSTYGATLSARSKTHSAQSET